VPGQVGDPWSIDSFICGASPLIPNKFPPRLYRGALACRTMEEALPAGLFEQLWRCRNSLVILKKRHTAALIAWSHPEVPNGGLIMTIGDLASSKQTNRSLPQTAYSLDPRKRYIIMPMVIMSAAAAIWLIWGSRRTRTFWPRGSSVAISAICIFGCLTSLLVMSIYKMEMKRVYLLADLIVQNTISDSLQADWRPYLKSIWPSSGFDPHFLTELCTLGGTNRSCSPHKVRSALCGAWKSSVGIVAQVQKQLLRFPLYQASRLAT
jgi:hypothetical protein